MPRQETPSSNAPRGESSPLLLSWYRIPFLGLVLLLLALAASACTGSRPGEWKFGNALAVRIPEKAVVDEVAYTWTDGKHYVLRPKQEGNKFLVVRLIVANSRSTQISMRVGPDTVTFLGRVGTEYPGLHPLPEGGAAQEVAEAPAGENRYVPFVWGTFDMLQGYQVDGWMVFEVPSGSATGRIRWDTGDTIYLDV